MKTLALAFIALAFTGCFSPGPQTPTTPEQQAQRYAGIANIVAHVATVEHLKQHPKDRPYFVAAHTALGVVVNSTNVTPADVAAALQQLPIRELQGNYGTIIIVAGTVLIQDGRERVNLDGNVYLRRIIEAIYSGMGSGLAQSKP